MKLNIILLGVCLLFSCIAYAQQEPMKWGKIDEQDLKMTVYEHDSTAHAVVLGDYGNIYFSYNDVTGLQLNIERHVRIKILKSEGAEWANVEIPLYKSGSTREKLMSLKGMVYNEVNGKLEATKMDRDARYQEEAREWLDVMKFTMPNVKEGTVLEYRYHKQSEFFYELETWVFQKEIPSRWSELELKVPESLVYKNFMQGYHVPAISEANSFSDTQFNGTLYRWAMAKLPALKNEAYITTLEDYASKIEFELSVINIPGQLVKYFSSDWDKLNKKFMDHSAFGGELKKQRQVKDLVKELTAGKTNPQDKIAAIFSYVQQKVKYNGLTRVYASQNFKETLSSKSGNAADLNLLLTAMLREAGFTANPVILSTRSNGRVNPVVPMEKNFNYVVCQLSLEESSMLLDATDPFLPLGMIPYRCMNGEGRLVSEAGTDWVPLLNNEKYQQVISSKLTLTEEGILKGNLVQKRDGYSAESVRERLLADGEEKYLEAQRNSKTNWSIEALKFVHQNDLSQKLEEHVTLEISDKAMLAGDMMYVTLLPAGVEESNPFKMDERQYPINFGCPEEKMLMFEIELPKGYVIETLPEPAVVMLPDRSAMFRYNVVKAENKIMVTSSLQIKKPVFLPQEYPYLKQLYQLMLAKQNEQLVLKKAL